MPRTRPTRTMGIAQFVGDASEPFGLSRLLTHRLDDQRTVEGLVRDPADLRAQLLSPGHQRREPAAVDDVEDCHARKDDGADQREHRVVLTRKTSAPITMTTTPTAIGNGAIGHQAASTSALALESNSPVGCVWCQDMGNRR